MFSIVQVKSKTKTMLKYKFVIYRGPICDDHNASEIPILQTQESTVLRHSGRRNHSTQLHRNVFHNRCHSSMPRDTRCVTLRKVVENDKSNHMFTCAISDNQDNKQTLMSNKQLRLIVSGIAFRVQNV